jgi:hypothetical protein
VGALKPDELVILRMVNDHLTNRVNGIIYTMHLHNFYI